MIPLQEFAESYWLNQAIEGEDPILVDFQEPGVRTTAPMEVLERIYERSGGQLVLGYIDISKALPLALSNRIDTLPTLCVFQNGHLLRTYRGVDRLEKAIRVFDEL